MQWQIWLTQPRTQKMLRLTLALSGGFFALWLSVAGYFFFSGGGAIAAARQKLAQLRQKIGEVTGALSLKKQDSARAKSLKIAPPMAGGGLQFADSLSMTGEAAGVEKINLRYKPPVPTVSVSPPGGNPNANAGGTPGNAGKESATPPSNPPASNPPAPGGQNASAQSANGTLTADGWGQAGFECEMTGTFESLTRTLEQMAKQPFVFEFTKADLQRSRVDPDGKVVLTMRLTGSLYGLPESK